MSIKDNNFATNSLLATLIAVGTVICPINFPRLNFAQNPPQSQPEIEKAIVEELNLLRTNPQSYADLLEKLISFESTGWIWQDNPARKQDIVKLIQVLRNLQPLPKIGLSSDLSRIASNLLRDTKSNDSSAASEYEVINFSFSRENLSEGQITSREGKKILVGLLSASDYRDALLAQTPATAGIACHPSESKCAIIYPHTTKSTQGETEIAKTQPYDLSSRGVLEEGDKIIPSDGSLYDAYIWEGKRGDYLTITLESNDFDTYLAVQDPQGTIIAENDDLSPKNKNSGLSLTLPKDGAYRIIINSYNRQGRGKYNLSVIKN